MAHGQHCRRVKHGRRVGETVRNECIASRPLSRSSDDCAPNRTGQRPAPGSDAHFGARIDGKSVAQCMHSPGPSARGGAHEKPWKLRLASVSGWRSLAAGLRWRRLQRAGAAPARRRGGTRTAVDRPSGGGSGRRRQRRQLSGAPSTLARLVDREQRAIFDGLVTVVWCGVRSAPRYAAAASRRDGSRSATPGGSGAW